MSMIKWYGTIMQLWV